MKVLVFALTLIANSSSFVLQPPSSYLTKLPLSAAVEGDEQNDQDSGGVDEYERQMEHLMVTTTATKTESQATTRPATSLNMQAIFQDKEKVDLILQELEEIQQLGPSISDDEHTSTPSSIGQSDPLEDDVESEYLNRMPDPTVSKDEDTLQVDEDAQDTFEVTSSHTAAKELLDQIQTEYYKLIPDDAMGFGWFDQRVQSLSTHVDVRQGFRFHTQPRAWDRSPSHVPSQHPLRAIARILQDAPAGSYVRLYASALTDPMALDLLIHHGSTKTIQIILHPDDYSIDKMKEFLERFARFCSFDAFFARLSVRVADTTSFPCAPHGVSQMRDTTLMTESLSTYGTYELSCQSRFSNTESMVALPTDVRALERFQKDWERLGDRSIEQVYPDFYPTSFTVPKRP